MMEKALAQELHRVADAAPIPADLFPTGRLTARPRRQWMVMVAAAVAALVLFGVTPAGSRVVSAAIKATGQVFMRHKIQLTNAASPGVRDEGVVLSNIQIGDTFVRETPYGQRQTATGMTLEAWRQSHSDWPLPTYRPPGPSDRVVTIEAVSPTVDTTWEEKSIHVYWSVKVGWKSTDVFYHLSRQVAPIGEAPIHTVYTNGGALKTEQRTVTLKGEPATAMKIGKTWILNWYHEFGRGSISSDMPLDELVKIAESLPSMK